MHFRSLRFTSAMLLFALGTAGIGVSAAEVPAKTAQRPVSQSEINRLLAEYRRSGSELDKKGEVVQQAIEAGQAAVTALSSAMDRELQTAMQRYLGKFQQQAAAVAKKQLRAVELAEVERLRATVLGLQKLGEGFTKEAIVEKGDPALRRLQELLVVGRSKVLKDSEDLQAERQRLQGLGSLWEKCQRSRHEHSSGAKSGGAPSAPPDFEQRLLASEQLEAILAMPMDGATKAVLGGNAKLAARIDVEEARAILALNVTRSLLGLPALAIDLGLCEAARDHSRDMETKGFFSHESPLEGKKTPWDRAKRFGTTAGAENIASGAQDGKAVNIMWFHSPGHHVNMLGKHKRVGIGRSGKFYTQMFGG